MKKVILILVLGLLFILIDLVTPSRVEACHARSLLTKNKTWAQHSAFEKLKCKAGWVIDDINPANYFKNKKKCQAYADRADTEARGKVRYKECMEYPNDY